MYCSLTLQKHVGDMVFISNLLGLGGHFGRVGHNCVYCEVHSTCLFDRKPSTKRTLSRLYAMAHLLRPGSAFPFTCPGCLKEFKTQKDLDDDVEWDYPVEYERQHMSSGWRRPPLIDVEPADYVLCCLHLLLSLTKLLFKKRVLPMLHSDEQAIQLNDFLSRIGVCIPKQTKVGQSLATEQTGRVRFTGPDCIALMRHWDEMLLLVHSGCRLVKGSGKRVEDT